MYDYCASFTPAKCDVDDNLWKDWVCDALSLY